MGTHWLLHGGTFYTLLQNDKLGEPLRFLQLTYVGGSRERMDPWLCASLPPGEVGWELLAWALVLPLWSCLVLHMLKDPQGSVLGLPSQALLGNSHVPLSLSESPPLVK